MAGIAGDGTNGYGYDGLGRQTSWTRPDGPTDDREWVQDLYEQADALREGLDADPQAVREEGRGALSPAADKARSRPTLAASFAFKGPAATD